MPTYHADAIVLHRLDYGEADRIVTLLTREHGKLAAIAKGARRGKSKVAGSLDLFERSNMMLAPGRTPRGRPPYLRRPSADGLRLPRGGSRRQGPRGSPSGRRDL